MATAAELGSNLDTSKKTPPVGLPKTQRIILEDNDNIPPNGLYVGYNGVGYLLKTGVEMSVPLGVIGILRDAVMAAPVIDPATRQVVGYRNRLKYNFQVIPESQAA